MFLWLQNLYGARKLHKYFTDYRRNQFVTPVHVILNLRNTNRFINCFVNLSANIQKITYVAETEMALGSNFKVNHMQKQNWNFVTCMQDFGRWIYIFSFLCLNLRKVPVNNYNALIYIVTHFWYDSYAGVTLLLFVTFRVSCIDIDSEAY